MTDDAKEAKRIRAKMKRGGTTDEENEWLAAYKPGPRGRAAAKATREVDAPPGSPVDSPHIDEPSVAAEFGPAAGETPAPDAPPVRPRFEGRKNTKGGASNWRDAYRAGASAGEREGTCVQLAALWQHALKKANATIVANGGIPAIPDDVIDGPLGKCLVLTVDKFLPADFSVGPEVESSIASSVIIGQAWWLARKAKQSPAADVRRAAEYTNPKAPEATGVPAPATQDDFEERRLAIVPRGGNGHVTLKEDAVF